METHRVLANDKSQNLRSLRIPKTPQIDMRGGATSLKKTDLEPGTDPIEATQRRQAELEWRESKALRETKTRIFHMPDSRR